jgi:hypothetical protein
LRGYSHAAWLWAAATLLAFSKCCHRRSMWYLTSAESRWVGSDWARAQIFARHAATLAKLRMLSIVVSGTDGYVHLSSIASISSLAFSHHCSRCSCDSVVGGGGVYGGGSMVDHRISVGESSEE